MGLEFNKCCFFIDLRTGCLIIGYLNLIWEIIMILWKIVELVAVSGVLTVLNNKNLTAQNKDPMFLEVNQELQRIVVILFAVIAAILVFLILFLGFTIVLLVGLHQYKRGHVKAYLIYGLIFIVLAMILLYADSSASHTAGPIVLELIHILLGIYCLLVIRSYYLKMDDPTNKPVVYNTA